MASVPSSNGMQAHRISLHVIDRVRSSRSTILVQ
jgi:hypothetical protein